MNKVRNALIVLSAVALVLAFVVIFGATVGASLIRRGPTDDHPGGDSCGVAPPPEAPAADSTGDGR